MTNIKLNKVINIKGFIKVITGLHIGGGNEKMEIGGMDNPIIRNPTDNMPYIPGSSLKGKMRSLLEWKEGKLNLEKNKEGEVHSCYDKNCPICRIFGSTKRIKERGSTRLIVRDAFINKNLYEKFMEKGLQITEDKYENTINRINAEAVPRPIERVVPGVIFDFEMIYKIIDTGDGGEKDREYLKYIYEALELIENDTLGGGGSRGNGKVEFVIKNTDENDDRKYLGVKEYIEKIKKSNNEQGN